MLESIWEEGLETNQEEGRQKDERNSTPSIGSLPDGSSFCIFSTHFFLQTFFFFSPFAFVSFPSVSFVTIHFHLKYFILVFIPYFLFLRHFVLIPLNFCFLRQNNLHVFSQALSPDDTFPSCLKGNITFDISSVYNIVANVRTQSRLTTNS